MVPWDILKADTSFARHVCSLNSLGYIFDLVVGPVIMCRESRLSCIYLPDLITL